MKTGQSEWRRNRKGWFDKWTSESKLERLRYTKANSKTAGE